MLNRDMECNSVIEMAQQFCEANTKQWVTDCLSTFLGKFPMGLNS